MVNWGRQRSSAGFRAPMLAGWLFADLILVLFIAAFTSLPAPPAPSGAAPTSSPTHGLTPSPKPSAHATARPRVLEEQPQTFSVGDVSPADVSSSDPATSAAAVGKLLGELRNELAARKVQGRQAGFVIVLAYGPIDGIGQAISTANSVVGILKKQESQFSGAAGLGYWSGSAGFEFKIFFFA
jgi:hypothetical protein